MRNEKEPNLVSAMKTYLRFTPCQSSGNLDERILTDGLAAMGEAPYESSAWSGWDVGRIIMRSRIGKLALAALVVVSVLLIGFPGQWGESSAWALEQTIEALKPYRAAYLSGTLMSKDGHPTAFEMWMRANPTGVASQEMLLRTTAGGLVWVSEGKSYQHTRGDKTVYYEDALTQGISHWFGPHLFILLGQSDHLEVTESRDERTLVMRGSTINMNGPTAWEFVVNRDTHLPVSVKQWSTMDHSGAPGFAATEILYYDDLPDSTFQPEISQEVTYQEIPPQIVETNLSVLGGSRFGLAVNGRTYEAAAQDILQQTYEAIITRDLDTIRRLCPLTSLTTDAYLETLLLVKTPEQAIASIDQVGGIVKRGHSPLGPFVVVPCTVTRQDGSHWRTPLIVQFRGSGASESCVVYGPYGMPVQIIDDL
ncbi:hypothetical protein ACFL6U_20255 [Planctomycetota bacterium]